MIRFPHVAPIPAADARRGAIFTGMLAGFLIAGLALLGVVPDAFAQAADADASTSSATFNLQPKFKEGMKSRYEFWTKREQTITMTSPSRTQTTDVKYIFKGESTWSVKSVNDDGSATCIMTLDWITVDATTKGAIAHNDSRLDSGDSDRMHKLLRAIATVPLTVDMAADGSVSAISGTDAVHQRAGDLKAPSDLDFIETASETATLPFALADIQPGKTWSADFTWSHDLGKMDYQTTYTFDSVEHIAGVPVALVTAESELELRPDEPPVAQGAPEVSIRLLEAQSQSQVMFDLDRGEVVGRNNWQSTQVQTDVQLPDQTLSQHVAELIQSQVLRIEEE